MKGSVGKLVGVGEGRASHSLQSRQSGSRGTSWRFDYVLRSTWRSTRSSFRTGRTRRGEARVPTHTREHRQNQTREMEEAAHVVSSDEEPNSVWPLSVVLSVHLRLFVPVSTELSAARSQRYERAGQRTVGDGVHDPGDGKRAVVQHPRRHGLRPHEVAAKDGGGQLHS